MRILGILFVALALASSAPAQELRKLRPIGARRHGATSLGFSAPWRPVQRAAVERAVADIAQSWNRPALLARLSASFQDRSRLVDTVLRQAPRDATLRVLAIEGVTLLGQKSIPALPGDPETYLTSQVAVVVRTQIEFDDPPNGFRRLEGRSEFVLEIREVVPR